MGLQLAKKRKGKKTQVAMSEEQLRDFARKPVKKASRLTDMVKK